MLQFCLNIFRHTWEKHRKEKHKRMTFKECMCVRVCAGGPAFRGRGLSWNHSYTCMSVRVHVGLGKEQNLGSVLFSFFFPIVLFFLVIKLEKKIQF